MSAAQPRDVRVLTGLFFLVFAYGAVVHAVQIVGGGSDPYPCAPTAIPVFFVALVVLDPLAALLIALQWRVGIAIGIGVLALDAVANGIVNYPPHVTEPGVTAGRVGQMLVLLLAVGLAAAAPRLWRYFR
ncbi:hypothetical protein [Rhodococcus sp. H29-C3]|uniref:hypothetical protein n=1 Tax=Rhodococcus sp. H29-C3 TaxID=3046307 RepID=UPI0024B8C058|nr:hypothetical protein [Rhodococcus sp. H29-C3]MDJ0362449.1 hypothetical protein [Rhodococcus sp. H29-C3]